MPRKSLQGGYCRSAPSNCALEKTGCIGGTDDFFSSREMQDAPGAHGGSCLLQYSIKETLLGQCDDGKCSPNAASCGNGSAFYDAATANNPSCSIESTKFGKCGSRCSWSPEYCTSSESWTFPADDCSCDKVRIGGCLKGGDLYCSVSSLGCDSLSTWHGPTAVTTKTGDKCFICRAPSVVIDGGGTNGTPTQEDDDGTKRNSNGDDSSPSSLNSSKRPSTAVTVGVALGSVAGVTAIIIALMLVQSKRKKANKGDKQKQIMTVASGNEDGEEVSVL